MMKSMNAITSAPNLIRICLFHKPLPNRRKNHNILILDGTVSKSTSSCINLLRRLVPVPDCVILASTVHARLYLAGESLIFMAVTTWRSDSVIFCPQSESAKRRARHPRSYPHLNSKSPREGEHKDVPSLYPISPSLSISYLYTLLFRLLIAPLFWHCIVFGRNLRFSSDKRRARSSVVHFRLERSGHPNLP